VTLDFARTRAALAVYDADKPRVQASWAAAQSDEDVAACQAADKEAADKVREAFALDTAEVNSREHAFLINPDDPWLRRITRP